MDNGCHSYASDTLFSDQGLYRNVTVAVPPPCGHLHYWTTNDPPSIFSADASGSSHASRLGGHSTSPLPAYRDDLTCLKLGKRRCFGFTEEVSAGAAGRRPGRRGGNCGGGAGAAVRCIVDGCEAALERAREYHRRHRVCELHTKAPAVVVLGRHQRFCQQCSRFHAVSEFDESKRSCRRRLAGHNERRRKTASSHQGGAPSLLSSRINTSSGVGFSPSDLSLQCGAALRELIAEHRATVLAHQQLIQQESGPRSSSVAWGSDVETGSHVTLNLMQCPSSAFRLLSMKPKQQQQQQQQHEDRCCLLWN